MAAGVVAALHVPQLRQDPVVEQAMRVETSALLGVLNAVCDSVGQLATTLGEAFAHHPDHEIITSFSGLADVSGAIVLGEIGDDRNRFVDDRSLQAFAGSAPVTRASGKSRTVTRRRIKKSTTCADVSALTGIRPPSGTCSTGCGSVAFSVTWQAPALEEARVTWPARAR